MSMQSWLRTYYPISADALETATPFSNVGELILLEHALQKWTGLKPENLESHDVRLDIDQGLPVVGRRPVELIIDASSCTLCIRYIESEDTVLCKNCPLYRVRGVACDKPIKGESLDEAPYGVFLRDEDPTEMIELLVTAIDNNHAEQQCVTSPAVPLATGCCEPGPTN